MNWFYGTGDELETNLQLASSDNAIPPRIYLPSTDYIKNTFIRNQGKAFGALCRIGNNGFIYTFSDNTADPRQAMIGKLRPEGYSSHIAVKIITTDRKSMVKYYIASDEEAAQSLAQQQRFTVQECYQISLSQAPNTKKTSDAIKWSISHIPSDIPEDNAYLINPQKTDPLLPDTNTLKE